jgi:hypothetical protein
MFRLHLVQQNGNQINKEQRKYVGNFCNFLYFSLALAYLKTINMDSVKISNIIIFYYMRIFCGHCPCPDKKV